ncbi:hypothetical protein [Pseudarthrobacter sulfonivorans]|uniref:hypothetical protein n=1 Tax=Pseudarthrobacter sulfonivorans TaxID=121292 RepID=UPI002866721B|nr:hypothetical protein [Pseudarthrobacter sulfonivorans]MDR6416959.1 hypothetical protein [Pseudarthrobacter sulfonivorans]
MTTLSHTTAPDATSAAGQKYLTSVEDLDLTPEGLADAPAHQQDPESIVHTGNS